MRLLTVGDGSARGSARVVARRKEMIAIVHFMMIVGYE
jgi:hypothetical protein